ncbi:hypothetical protein Hypma_000207 [Hypsizygus marmoreus]|uniref:Uncharacterized protein n=1 Tax=Hypsizygus marmoreus TaxID=39966 RepID=A0A369JDP1_HYPMA|nr:hypothetical protein Hypma_000207 [Hypsizygus marmoreus]
MGKAIVFPGPVNLHYLERLHTPTEVIASGRIRGIVVDELIYPVRDIHSARKFRYSGQTFRGSNNPDS